MISQLQNLEKLQIDFWGNQSNDDAYEEIYEILKNSEVCRNLKEVRIFCWADDTKNPIKLIKSFSLFTNLTKLSFSVDLCDISQEIAIGLNQILQQNKQTLKTLSNHYAGDANSFESQNIFGNNDCCQECQEGENIENQDDDDDEEEAEEQEQENADFNQRQINQQHFNMDRKKLDMYLIVLEHYDFKMRELIILTAYYKTKNIKYLRFKSLESLNVLAQNGQFNLKDFENLQQLSISSDYSGISLEAASEFFNTVFDQLSQPKKLNKIYIDLDNFELGFDQIAQISTKISQLQNLETLRLELGHNQLKDEGCQCITQAISKLTLLKELILGLENNQLGNFSFKQVFLMISQLVNLERLQIDFWGNESNDLAYEDLYEILRNSKVCNNLKEVRMYCDTPYRIKKNPIKLIDSFGLFNSLTKISFSVDQYNFLLETAIGLNTILINNCKTLKTVMIDFLKNQDQQNFEPSNQIQAVFKNMDKMVNLENLFIQFHSKQSYSSACDFFEEIKKCPKLLRLGITSSFSEVSTSSLGQVIDYFKTILEIQFLLQFEYAKYSSDLDFLWYDCFFQQDWSYKHFIDPYLVNQACFNIKDQKQRKHFCQLIQDIQEQYIGDGDSFDSHQYSEEGEEDDDEEEADYGPDESSYEENNDEDDEVDSIDLGNNQEVQQNSDEEEEHDNFVYGEVEKKNIKSGKVLI
ncbi:hypothetical protein ABPG73_011206 [Tetrahymena malaccensis]